MAGTKEIGPGVVLTEACEQTRDGFSAYLDGALDGRTMAQLAAHLRECPACAAEFAAWRSMQEVLGALGPATPPRHLQGRLRDALANERGAGRHLSPWQRWMAFSERTLAPAGLRLGAGLLATLVILGSGSWLLGSALPVQANDDRMAHLTAPRYLYSQSPVQPLDTAKGYVAVLVDAKVDAEGRVYDYSVIDGPKDARTRVNVEANLLGSVFKPAMVFGVPVPGHVIVTYTAVSAQG